MPSVPRPSPCAFGDGPSCLDKRHERTQASACGTQRVVGVRSLPCTRFLSRERTTRAVTILLPQGWEQAELLLDQWILPTYRLAQAGAWGTRDMLRVVFEQKGTARWDHALCQQGRRIGTTDGLVRSPRGSRRRSRCWPRRCRGVRALLKPLTRSVCWTAREEQRLKRD